MTKASALVLAAYLVALIADASGAEPLCARPLVSKKSVALSIFNAVAGGLETSRIRCKYVTEISDEGASWAVFQSLRGGNSVRAYTDAKGRRMEDIQMTFGGGGLGMSIDKCTGAMSGVQWQR